MGKLKNDQELLKLIDPDDWNNIPVPICKAMKDIAQELLIAI